MSGIARESWRRVRRMGLLATVLTTVLAADPAAAERRLSWRDLGVEARLEADGALRLRERHGMVFTGDWNGGERIFRLEPDHDLELLGMARVDPETGAEVPLAEGSLDLVDRYDWLDRRTLRWRSRRPSDPPFEETEITYLIDYRLERVLVPTRGRYLLDHDFAFPDGAWPVERFTLELEVDPIWRPTRPLATSHGPLELGSHGSYVVRAELDYTGEAAPAAVRHPPPVRLRLAAFAGAALAMFWLALGFLRREAAAGRFEPQAAPPAIDGGWLEEHLFDYLPEEAGALWDRKVGPPEVAAILARWEAEGRIASEVVAREGRFQKDVLRLELQVERDSFSGYEKKLMRKLFFGGRRETDTEAIRKHYRSRGFDPASVVRRGIERRLAGRGRESRPRRKLPGRRWRLTLGLFLASAVLMGVEALDRPLPALQLAILLIAPLVVLYLLLGLVFATVYRSRLERLGWWALGFVLPGLAFWGQAAFAALFDRLLPEVDFAPQPGIAGTLALAVLSVAVWNSLLNRASTLERPGGLVLRRRVAAARRLLARELKLERPRLRDDWMPHLLALGLGRRVDRWWRRFGAAEVAMRPAGQRFTAGSSSPGGGPWTGGGGGFGGGGASASWAAVAGSVASGVARPSSGGSGGGGGGSSSSSGGGGGGGW